mgnify:CR=1 FL=1
MSKRLLRDRIVNWGILSEVIFGEYGRTVNRYVLAVMSTRIRKEEGE